MTPKQIEILMRIYDGTVVEQVRALRGEEVDALVSLSREGMVKDSSNRSMERMETLGTIRLTDRGKRFVEAILNMPLPGRRSEWVMPS